jgi:hypothetical protein
VLSLMLVKSSKSARVWVSSVLRVCHCLGKVRPEAVRFEPTRLDCSRGLPRSPDLDATLHQETCQKCPRLLPRARRPWMNFA